MAYIVMALYSDGLYSYGLYSDGLYSHGLYSHGLYSYGLYSYGLYNHGAGSVATVWPPVRRRPTSRIGSAASRRAMRCASIGVLVFVIRMSVVIVPAANRVRRSIFDKFSAHADGERQAARSGRRAASERSRRDASLDTFRSERALGVRRRHAPEISKKAAPSLLRQTLSGRAARARCKPTKKKDGDAGGTCG